MCGIFGIISNKHNPDSDCIQHRGPDNTTTKKYLNQTYTFYRLKINDLSDDGNQPFEDENFIWMCNGEIYNFKKLKNKYNITCKSKSDCEVISQLYNILGIQSMCRALDGVFAISLYNKKDDTLYLIRDMIGVRPIYYYKDDHTFTFASESKALNFVDNPKNIIQVPPSSYIRYDISTNKSYINCYYDVDNIDINSELKFSMCTQKINELLISSIQKRLISDRPIGCLLSGGLDSSLVASILSKLLIGRCKKLKTFSVGFKDSEDLKYAKKVAKFLKTDHYELILDYGEVIKRIPEVIKKIESYDITTIRASVGMYLLSEYISKNHSEKVIFSGEGSDEIFGGYLYFHKSPTLNEFEIETKRLVKDLCYFDVLRADRCTAAFGLELRVPFLDKELVNFVMSIPGNIRKYSDLEKYVLRKSFERDYLPIEILMRKKEGFSDGVGGIKKPFYKHIQESLDGDDDSERMWYIQEYDRFYKNVPIPYYWMPKWIQTNNPSGRILMTN
jgi:asparagine synthase (glutamine-hydrolysing)